MIKISKHVLITLIFLCTVCSAWIPSSPAFSSETAKTKTITALEYRDKLKGGFLGQSVGVCYGYPYEFRAEGWTFPEWLMRKWQPDMVLGALEQDDLYVELTFLETLERHGLDVSYEQIGEDFGKTEYPLWHANNAARENIRKGIMPPLSGHPRYNGHADDIGYQIESDVFGLISPGMPLAAQQLAWKFGHLNTWGDGSYGGVFISGMYSAAFFESDPVKVVETGLASIPAESNYAKTIQDVLDEYRKDPSDWKAAWRIIEKKWAPN